MAQENYDARHDIVLRKWERDLERQKSRTEASEENFKKTFSNLLKDENVKRSLAADASAATKDPNRQTATRNVEALREQFVNRGYHSDEVITGDERPWERD